MANLIEKRVFVNEKNKFGDKIGVIIDEGKKLTPEERQAITTNSGYDEVVFINDSNIPEISIYQPQNEIKFAGTALLAAIKELQLIRTEPFAFIHCLGNRIDIRIDGNIYWVQAEINIMPPWKIVEVESIDDIEKLSISGNATTEHTLFWAWKDEKAGTIRARTFAPDWDVPESEANGSGTVLLARKLKRSIKVIHGKGSLVFANYINDTSIEVGEMGGLVE